MKSKIILLLLTSSMLVGFTTSNQIIKTNDIKEVDSVEILNLRSYKVDQVEGIMKVEYEKIKEIERKKEEEIEQKRILEELNRKIEFNPYDVSEPSNLTIEEWTSALEDTALVTLASAFHWYEEQYQVNGLLIASIVALESSWGRSSLAISHNNLTGYVGRDGNYYLFNDWGSSLEETFRLIGEEYISEDGLFYNGRSVGDINIKYCELDSWTDKVIDIAYELKNKVEER